MRPSSATRRSRPRTGTGRRIRRRRSPSWSRCSDRLRGVCSSWARARATLRSGSCHASTTSSRSSHHARCSTARCVVTVCGGPCGVGRHCGGSLHLRPAVLRRGGGRGLSVARLVQCRASHRRELAPTCHLILVERSLAEPLPWESELQVLVREYSTNREYARYDTVSELEARGLLAVGGRAQTRATPYQQPVDGYVESFHSRTGFSRAQLRLPRSGVRRQVQGSSPSALPGRYCVLGPCRSASSGVGR